MRSYAEGAIPRCGIVDQPYYAVAGFLVEISASARILNPDVHLFDAGVAFCGGIAANSGVRDSSR
jgi:hypothetical protein